MVDILVETGTGSTTSNSYISLDDAETYHEMRLHNTDWSGAADDTKEIALMWATKLLDSLVLWDGWKYTEDQALEWPRDGVNDRAGYAVDVDEIPQFLKDATAEYAMHLIASDVTAEAGTKGFKFLKAGPLEMEINRWDRTSMIPKSVWSLIRFCATKASSKSKHLVRV